MELKVPEGMHILTELPSAESIKPKPFTSGSYMTALKVMSYITGYCGRIEPNVVAEWRRWYDKDVPKTDRVQDYLQLHPEKFVLPFYEILLTGVLPDLSMSVEPRKPNSRYNFNDTEIEKVKATDNVEWSRRGRKKIT
jgi:hypothetical protein